MRQQILISPRDLHAAQESNACIVVDCRFDLSDPGSGYRDYLEAHIPGAVYAHLDDDLSSPVTANSGRHPLPDADKFAAFLARSGWQPGIRLVAYDNAGGAIAARLWWLMKYFGHDCAALLDGGITSWQSAGYELESGRVTTSTAVPVSLSANGEMVVSTTEVLEGLGKDGRVLVDVRASERYSGEFEPIDSVAGHVPGSVNYPFQLNLSQNGNSTRYNKSGRDCRDCQKSSRQRTWCICVAQGLLHATPFLQPSWPGLVAQNYMRAHGVNGYGIRPAR